MPEEHASRLASWREIERRYRASWTGRGQGVATDGVSWFVTQNDRSPGVSRYSADFSTREAWAEIPRTVADHVGAVSIVDDVVSIALEGPEALITFDKDLRQQSLVPIDRPVEVDGQAHLAWCSINPANGVLYTCDWNHASVLVGYDPESGSRRPGDDIALDEAVHRVQGAAFTSNGRVYLASDDRLSLSMWFRAMLGLLDSVPSLFPGIHCFDVETGAETDYLRVPNSTWPPFLREIEGLGVGEIVVGGEVTHVHLSLLVKNHTWIRDSVRLKSFVVPDPTAL